MQRSYVHLSRLEELMCHHCLAGTARRPFEDQSFQPCWEGSLYKQRPWPADYDPPLSAIPYERAAPEKLYKQDVFHNLKLGVYRDWAGSCLLLLLDRWDYFQLAGQSNDLPTKLDRAHSHFQLFCESVHKSAALHSFTKSFLNRKSARSFPWFNCKGSDIILITQWLAALMRSVMNGPLSPEHVPIADLMRRACVAALRYFDIQYQHNLWLTKRCASRLYESGFEFQQIYSRMAHLSMTTLEFTGFAMKPKSHCFGHTQVELKQQILNPQCERVLSPQIFACEQNEDLIGKVARISRRVHQRRMSWRVITLFLTKSKALYMRHVKAKPLASKIRRSKR